MRYIPNPNRKNPAKTDNVPAYKELDAYPENKNLTPFQLREINRRREEDFRLEREKKMADAKAKALAEAQKKMMPPPSSIPLSGYKDIGWSSPPSSEDSTIDALETEYQKMNEDIIIDEDTTEETPSIPQPGEYCIVYEGDIVHTTASLAELKQVILDYSDQNPSLELSDLIVMKRLSVDWLNIGE
jgi:hypothetical protein